MTAFRIADLFRLPCAAPLTNLMRHFQTRTVLPLKFWLDVFRSSCLIYFRQADNLSNFGLEILLFYSIFFFLSFPGNRVISSYGLLTKLDGYSYDYDPNLNPAIINAFAAAANRYGHSLVQVSNKKFGE